MQFCDCLKLIFPCLFQHLKNRQRLIDEGKVPTPDGMTLTPNKVNTFKATKPPLRKKRSKKK